MSRPSCHQLRTAAALLHWCWTSTGWGLWRVFPAPGGGDLMLITRPGLLLLHLLSGGLLAALLFKPSRTLASLLLLNLLYVILYPFAPVPAANLFFYGSPLVGSLQLMKHWRGASSGVSGLPPLKQQALFFAAATLLYTLSGVYFTEAVGEHAGDEGHYLTQARSLYQDGDLDLKNNLENPGRRHPEYFHIAMTSKHEKWYSWHTPGLSFVLAPTMGGGLWPRHGVLGAIAAGALLGMWILARQFGAREPYAWSIVGLTGSSVFWVVYASRALPEVLGAALAVWAAVGILAQRERPWISLIPAIPGVVFLPWTQTRFIPLALTLMGCYGLQGLLSRNENWPRKLLRLSLFTLGCLAGFAWFMWFQYQRYEGGEAYPVGDLLFSLPAGLWHTLASSRGIGAFFPILLPALTALPLCLLRRETRRDLWIPLLLFASVYLTSCATVWFTGGSCLPGRFLLVVCPIVLAAFAGRLSALPPAFQGLTAYAGLYAAGFTVYLLPWLSAMGKSFSNPFKIDLIHPMLLGLCKPLYDPMFATRLFPGLGLIMLAGLLLLWHRAGKKTVAAVCLSFALLYFSYPAMHPFQDGLNARSSSPLDVAGKLRATSLQQARLMPRRQQESPSDIFAFSNWFYENRRLSRGATLEDLGVRVQEGMISLPRIEENDWQDRPLKWATLTAPFRERAGTAAFALEGQMSGNCRGELVIREGNDTLLRQALAPGESVDLSRWLELKGRGEIYILLSLEGSDGSFELTSLKWTPVTDWMREDLKLRLPLSLD